MTVPSPTAPWTSGLVALLAAAAWLLPGCDEAAKKAAELAEEEHARTISIPVRVATAAAGTVSETLSIQGRLEVWRREILSAPAAGIIREFPSLPDQEVKAGDLVLLLDPPMGEAEEVAKATLLRDRAKRSLDRLEHLAVVAPLTVSVSELETQREAFSDAETDLELMRKRQPRRRITAPFAGVLVKFQGVVGDALGEGGKIAELLDISRYRLRLELPETSLRRIALGQAVEVRALGDDSRATGTVLSLPSAIDTEKGTGLVVIDTSHPPHSWRPGGFATAKLVLHETAAAVVLAREKVQSEEGRSYCYVADQRDGVLVARRVWLELGVNDELNVAVTKGLSAGDQIIVDGLAGVSDGVRIALAPAAGDAPATAPAAPAAPAAAAKATAATP